MTAIRKNLTTTTEQLRPGDSILNYDGSKRYLIQSAPEYLPPIFARDTRLVRMHVLGTDYAGPMLFTVGDFVYASVVVGVLKLRVQQIAPTTFRGTRYRVVITTPNGRRIQRTIPRDYSWSATFPHRDAARVIAEEWYQADVDVTPLYGNTTPGSITFAAQEA